MEHLSLNLIKKSLKESLLNELRRTGILFRLHTRIKDEHSIVEKLVKKNYRESGKLMQDVIGLRITTYFVDDIKVIVDLCERLFGSIELVYDTPDTDVFKPLRKNMICKFPAEQTKIFEEVKKENEIFEFIDNTFEVQFRTTLSEGWHEVDHTLRYKHEKEWKGLQNESRMLNGLYASLETSDQALKALFDDIAYYHYKQKMWAAMIRNKFRLKFKLEDFSDEIVQVLDNDTLLAKRIFKLNRVKVIDHLSKSNISIPMTLNNLVYFINYFFIKDAEIHKITPQVLIEEFEL